MTLTEMRAKRAALAAEARAENNKITAQTTEAEAKAIATRFDELLDEADKLTAQIEREERLGTLEVRNGASADDALLQRLVAAGALGGGGEGRAAPDMWVDDQGKPVPVLGREHRFADHCPQLSQEQRGLTFGGYVNALINPASRTEREIRALSQTSDATGGATVPLPLLSRFIDLMRNRTRCIQAGALTTPMTSMTLSIARIASDPVAAWKAEAASISPDSAMGFEKITFTAKKLIADVKLSRELLQDSVNVNAAVEAAFAGAFAVELDRVALRGHASLGEPTGVRNQSGVTINDRNGTNVTIDGYNVVLDGVQSMLEDNAPFPTAMIVPPRSLIKYAKLVDTTGQPLQRPPLIANLPFLDTMSIPTNLTQGSPADLTEHYLGFFGHMLIGVRTEMTLEVLRELYAATDEIGIRAVMRCDVQLEHPQSFVVFTEVL